MIEYMRMGVSKVILRKRGLKVSCVPALSCPRRLVSKVILRKRGLKDIDPSKPISLRLRFKGHTQKTRIESIKCASAISLMVPVSKVILRKRGLKDATSQIPSLLNDEVSKVILRKRGLKAVSTTE